MLYDLQIYVALQIVLCGVNDIAVLLPFPGELWNIATKCIMNTCIVALDPLIGFAVAIISLRNPNWCTFKREIRWISFWSKRVAGLLLYSVRMCPISAIHCVFSESRRRPFKYQNSFEEMTTEISNVMMRLFQLCVIIMLLPAGLVGGVNQKNYRVTKAYAIFIADNVAFCGRSMLEQVVNHQVHTKSGSLLAHLSGGWCRLDVCSSDIHITFNTSQHRPRITPVYLLTVARAVPGRYSNSYTSSIETLIVAQTY